MESLRLTGEKPLQAFEIAKAVNRDDEYREWYKVYSKLTHATAWAILGGSEEPVSWEKFALLLLLKCNQYASGCFTRIAEKTGLFDPRAEALIRSI